MLITEQNRWCLQNAKQKHTEKRVHSIIATCSMAHASEEKVKKRTPCGCIARVQKHRLITSSPSSAAVTCEPGCSLFVAHRRTPHIPCRRCGHFYSCRHWTHTSPYLQNNAFTFTTSHKKCLGVFVVFLMNLPVRLARTSVPHNHARQCWTVDPLAGMPACHWVSWPVCRGLVMVPLVFSINTACILCLITNKTLGVQLPWLWPSPYIALSMQVTIYKITGSTQMVHCWVNMGAQRKPSKKDTQKQRLP